MGGGALIALMLLLIILGGSPLRQLATQVRVLPIEMLARPFATARALTIMPAPTFTLTPTSKLTYPSTSAVMPTATPALALLPASAKIRPGIYVKAVKPEGVILRKGAGFDADYITTLPMGTILYVYQGPVSADSLSWIWVGDGVRGGWARQDEVVAYAVKATP